MVDFPLIILGILFLMFIHRGCYLSIHCGNITIYLSINYNLLGQLWRILQTKLKWAYSVIPTCMISGLSHEIGHTMCQKWHIPRETCVIRSTQQFASVQRQNSLHQFGPRTEALVNLYALLLTDILFRQEILPVLFVRFFFFLPHGKKCYSEACVYDACHHYDISGCSFSTNYLLVGSMLTRHEN